MKINAYCSSFSLFIISRNGHNKVNWIFYTNILMTIIMPIVLCGGGGVFFESNFEMELPPEGFWQLSGEMICSQKKKKGTKVPRASHWEQDSRDKSDVKILGQVRDSRALKEVENREWNSQPPDECLCYHRALRGEPESNNVRTTALVLSFYQSVGCCCWIPPWRKRDVERTREQTLGARGVDYGTTRGSATKGGLTMLSSLCL